MQFNLNLDIVDYCLYGALGLVLLYQIYFVLRYLGGILYQRKSLALSEQPGVTVVVCARNEQDNMDAYLQSLLTQDYPTFEVIVVDDGSEDATGDVIESYAQQDKRLRHTFVPRNANVGSTKKLGLTLAAKAAQYDYLLLTDADCCPESSHWISSMMAGFAKPGTEIVLGYGAYFPRQTALNRLIRFDTLINGLHYLGAAATRSPYMGVGRNLAYRKDVFFQSGGFTHHMMVRSGDDDLFVNSVATRRNTAVVTVPESVTWSLPKTSLAEWLQQKRRHLSVSPRYKTQSKLHLGLEPVTRGLFYALIIILAVLGGPLGWIVAGSAYLLRMALIWLIVNLGAKRMGQPYVGLELIVYDIVLPLTNLYMMISLPFRRVVKW